MASGASLSGYVRPMTAVTLPASMSSFRTTRSSFLISAKNRSSLWLTKRDERSARSGRASGQEDPGYALTGRQKASFVNCALGLEVRRLLGSGSGVPGAVGVCAGTCELSPVDDQVFLSDGPTRNPALQNFSCSSRVPRLR